MPSNQSSLSLIMNLFRIILVALAVWIIIRLWQSRKTKSKQVSRKTPGKAIPTMVPCAVCAMHIPDSEALKRGDKYYCSQQHLDADT